MEALYTAECTTFPGNGVIQITLTPVKDSENSYEIECPIKGSTVGSILSSLGCEEETATIDQDSMSFPVEGSLITDLIGSLLPIEEPEEMVTIIEHIKVRKPILLNNKIVESGTLSFYHKGSVK